LVNWVRRRRRCSVDLAFWKLMSDVMIHTSGYKSINARSAAICRAWKGR
jgi:hypothetical protein